MNHSEMILILDFGSQYTQLIARRVRELKVYCEIHPYRMALDEIKAMNPKAIILSGGPSSVYDQDAPECDPQIFELGLPILGICYGAQLMTKVLGGKVGASDHREYGPADILIDDFEDFFAELSGKEDVWMSHGDKIEQVPEGFQILAHTSSCPVAAMRSTERKMWAVQFHPEVVHTVHGKEMLKSFAYGIAGCKGDWTMKSFLEQSIEQVRQQVGDKRVICGLSGGVDSSVVAVLLHKAIGDQLTCIFVDNGVLRTGEREKVADVFRNHYHINLVVVDAEERFLKRLAGEEDPEKKRKGIGNEFIVVFEEEAEKLGGADFLAQGTLYPDVIESVSVKGPSAVIKSHHNVGGLPERMKMDLVEPLRELFKDEVRLLGLEMGMPEEMIYRQPFPGPGLAIRVLGAVDKPKLDILRKADVIILEEIKNAGVYRDIWQSFGVLLPVKTVGVMGDKRTYENVLALRAVSSKDGMTADWVPLPYELLGKISSRVINEVPGINRVVYDISSKPPGTIEWE